MCNNRCVFCVSGQRTAMGEALPLEVEPILERIREAHGRGHRKITLLGGEPTLQPGFLRVVSECVALGFEDIVIFTNGAKTARASFIDEVRATGGRFTWRISIQGATKESHERTTRKDRSFDRIVRTLDALRDRGERITINMCVVRSNFESVAEFPALLGEYGVRQLHLDMVRPMDAGIRTEEELREMIPRYTEMVEPLSRMVAGFDDGFDVNIGNLPYCIAPELAPWIHHDGRYTDTIAIDGDDRLSRPWDKYLVKRRDKIKPESCGACVFEHRCSGVFEAYERFYGTDELVPIDAERLVQLDPSRRFLALHLRGLVEGLDGWSAEERGVEEVALTWDADPALRLVLRPPEIAGAAARYGRFGVHVEAAPDVGAAVAARSARPVTAVAAEAALFALHEAFVARGETVVHPLGADALGVGARSVAMRLGKLRAAAPFGDLVWRGVRTSDDGRRAELDLVGPDGEHAVVWLTEEHRRARGGYRLEVAEPTEAQITGLRSVMTALEG